MRKRFTQLISMLLGSMLLVSTSSTSSAADVAVEITNATQSIFFTPLLVSAHDSTTHLFQVGEEASGNLQAMAEGGDLTGLLEDLGGEDADTVANPAQGLLGPGESISVNLMTAAGNSRLSIAAMLLPTNDGFVGLDALEIPTAPGTYIFYLNGYDAGTEANDELITGGGAPGVPGIPADPGGLAGSGGSGVASTEENTTVHIHRGNLGDSDPEGGPSDLDNSVHRWLNPVARVRITVQ